MTEFPFWKDTYFNIPCVPKEILWAHRHNMIFRSANKDCIIAVNGDEYENFRRVTAEGDTSDVNQFIKIEGGALKAHILWLDTRSFNFEQFNRALTRYNWFFSKFDEFRFIPASTILVEKMTMYQHYKGDIYVTERRMTRDADNGGLRINYHDIRVQPEVRATTQPHDRHSNEFGGAVNLNDYKGLRFIHIDQVEFATAYTEYFSKKDKK